MNPLIAREYIEGCLKIRTKSGAVIPFRMNPAQEKLYAVRKGLPAPLQEYGARWYEQLFAISRRYQRALLDGNGGVE